LQVAIGVTPGLVEAIKSAVGVTGVLVTLDQRVM